MWSCSATLTDCDMILSMTIWEVSEDAKEKGLPETMPVMSSSSPAMSSCITTLPLEEPFKDIWWEAAVADWEDGGGAKALETSKADTLHDRDKNSIGSRGVSGGLYGIITGSGIQGSTTGFSIFVCILGKKIAEKISVLSFIEDE